ncbi:MAG: DNA-3-methyladenine glycosylase I [Bacteroidota bacterium]
MEIPKGLIRGADGLLRCWWHGNDPEYLEYHDCEWGRPISDDGRLFEKICLEGFQAGLSWLTILRKRENFRAAFANFEMKELTGFGAEKVEELLLNKGIIRHRKKIESTLNNAHKALKIIEEFGSLAAYFWSFEPHKESRPAVVDHVALRKLTKTPASIRLSKDLKKRGWSFVGPTTAYAFMQAMGLVNDHIEGCYIRPEIEAARKVFVRPTP